MCSSGRQRVGAQPPARRSGLLAQRLGGVDVVGGRVRQRLRPRGLRLLRACHRRRGHLRQLLGKHRPLQRLQLRHHLRLVLPHPALAHDRAQLRLVLARLRRVRRQRLHLRQAQRGLCALECVGTRAQRVEQRLGLACGLDAHQLLLHPHEVRVDGVHLPLLQLHLLQRQQRAPLALRREQLPHRGALALVERLQPAALVVQLAPLRL
mmetsp:Transcript_41010/g.104894  ORF Transcript_41010/g.104894 Transcript_41010/m.104894 type:complete len:208 (-) Transcript_41010:150-773(-)